MNWIQKFAQWILSEELEKQGTRMESDEAQAMSIEFITAQTML